MPQFNGQERRVELRYDGQSDRLQLVEEQGITENGLTGLVIHASLELSKGRGTNNQTVQGFLALATLLTGLSIERIIEMKKHLKDEYLGRAS
jgi:hypothetical protein